MNQFQKYVSVLLVLTLALSVFTACGKKTIATVTEPAPVQVQQAADTQISAEQTVSVGYLV